MDENAPLVLQGLRQMTQRELGTIGASCALVQAQARQVLDRLPAQFKLAVHQAVTESDIQPEDLADANWPAMLQRLGRQAAARASETAGQVAVDLQRQLFQSVAMQTAALYRFGVTFDQLAQVVLGSDQPLDEAQSVLSRLRALWARHGGSGEPLEPLMLTGLASQLAARLLPAELARRLLELDWPAGPRPADAASLRQDMSARLNELIDQELRAQRAQQELALDNHVRLLFNRLEQTLDEGFAARRRVLDVPGAGPRPA